MKAKVIPDYERGLTFEKVWASIQELKEFQRKSEERPIIQEEKVLKKVLKHEERFIKQEEKLLRQEERVLKRDEALVKRDETFAKRDEALAKRDEILTKRIEAELKRTEALRKSIEAQNIKLKEQNKKAEEQNKTLNDQSKTIKEYKTNFKEVDRKLSKFGSRLGEIIEAMIEPNLMNKFEECGFNFTVLMHDFEVRGKGSVLAEIDAFLENDDEVMCVEVKSKPSNSDIKEHVNRMCKIREYAEGRNDKRKYYGAIGGMIFGKNEKAFALECGFFLIVPSGNTFGVIAPTGAHQARAW
jgi:hypothetical protein